MTLSDAITAVETASSSYLAAATTTTNDLTTEAAVQAKLDAAKAQVATDQAAQTDAATAFNASIDTLIQTATAAKIPVAPVQAA